MQDNWAEAFDRNDANKLQMLVKAVFVFDHQQLPLSH
jgi:hypothetical protein